jgi:phospholipase/carboxylesterase
MLLIGFSQGTMMALHIGLQRANGLAGIVGFSGLLLEQSDVAAARSKPPILLLHGDRDNVVPFTSMAAAQNRLVGAGFSVDTHVMPGTAHGISQDGLVATLGFLKANL